MLLGVLAVFAGAALWWQRASTTAAPEYVSAPARQGNVRGTVTATGRLEALDQVEVGAEISGRIVAVHVDFNDHVEKGQLLCELDPEQSLANRKQARAQLRANQAELASRRANLANAKAVAARSQKSFDRGLTSAQDLEAAVTAAAPSLGNRPSEIVVKVLPMRLVTNATDNPVSGSANAPEPPKP